MGAGLWFLFFAWQRASQAYAMLAVILLISAPMLALSALLARPDAPAEAGVSQAGRLVTDLHRIDGCLRFVQLCRAHLGVAVASLGVLWVCQLINYANFMVFLVFHTAASAVATATCLPWLASCERRLHEQRAQCRQRLGEVETLAWQPVSGARDVS